MLFLTLILTALGLQGSYAEQKIGYYKGNGTSAHGNEVFFVTLHTAATSAFGSDGYTITNLTERAVQMLEPGQFDVVVFPGGSGNGQAKAVGLKGLEALRKFVQAGGGYMGTCGGAFLGLQHVLFYGNGPAGRGPTTQEPWNRGHGTVQVEFTPQGLQDLRLGSAFHGNVTIMYWQGPIVKTKDFPANVSKLAFFRTEIHSLHTNETKGEMINTPAVTSMDGYGQGRVVLNSPHPELEPVHPQIYAGELQWVTRQKVDPIGKK